MKRSRIIALAGISSAFALIFESVSMFFEPMTLTFATLSAIFIALPFTKNFWLGGIISYVVCSICSFFIGGIQSVPFIVFFGAYAVVQWLIEYKLAPIIKIKWLKYTVSYILKLIWLEIAVAIIWFMAGAIIPTLILFGKEIKLTYMIFALGSIPLFLLYDLMMHLVFINLSVLVNKKIPDAEVVTKSTGFNTVKDIFDFDDIVKENTDLAEVFDDFVGDSPVTYYMQVEGKSFEKIKLGQKTIELRLYDSKRKCLKVGDFIQFTNVDNESLIKTQVIALYTFDTFEDLYKSIPLSKCGYIDSEIDHAKASDMRKYYTLEDELKYGVVGIEIKVVE